MVKKKDFVAVIISRDNLKKWTGFKFFPWEKVINLDTQSPEEVVEELEDFISDIEVHG